MNELPRLRASSGLAGFRLLAPLGQFIKDSINGLTMFFNYYIMFLNYDTNYD
jgi:hypothetical protein